MKCKGTRMSENKTNKYDGTIKLDIPAELIPVLCSALQIEANTLMMSGYKNLEKCLRELNKTIIEKSNLPLHLRKIKNDILSDFLLKSMNSKHVAIYVAVDNTYTKENYYIHGLIDGDIYELTDYRSIKNMVEGKEVIDSILNYLMNNINSSTEVMLEKEIKTEIDFNEIYQKQYLEEKKKSDDRYYSSIERKFIKYLKINSNNSIQDPFKITNVKSENGKYILSLVCSENDFLTIRKTLLKEQDNLDMKL